MRRRLCCWGVAASVATKVAVEGGGILDGGNGGQGPSRDHIFGTRRQIGGFTEKVEGCFDRFDSEFSVDLGRNDINNKRCQAICTDRGFSLAATQITTCFCGNNYPSVFHRVDTGLCNFPCSPDRATCFSFTCCGSNDRRLLTVSWSGEQDIMRRILLQLSHDYRINSPTFKAKIEGSYRDDVTMTLVPEGVMEGETLPPKYLSIGNGCPNGWSLFDRWCYKTHYAEARTYQDAVRVCQGEGGEIVTVASQAENKYLSDLLGGCQGWLGIRGYSSSPHADKDLSPSNLTTAAVDDGAAAGRRLSLIDSLAGMVRGSANATSVGDGGDKQQGKVVESLSGSGGGGGGGGGAAAAAAVSPLSAATTAATSGGWLSGLWPGGSKQVRRRRRRRRRRRKKVGRRHHHGPLKWVAPQYRAWSTMASDVVQHNVLQGAIAGVNLGTRFEQPWAKGDAPSSPHRLLIEYNDQGVYEFHGDTLDSKHTTAAATTTTTTTPDEAGQQASGSMMGALNAALQSTTTELETTLEGGARKQAVINLAPGDELLGLRADVGLRGLRSLSVIMMQNGSRVVHGPYGVQPSLLAHVEGNWTVRDIFPHKPIRGVYGYKNAMGRIRGLGFQLHESRSCSRMNETGSWVTVPCYAKEKEQAFVCEMRSGVFTPGCPRGWIPFDASCYRRGQADNVSWWDARTHCQEAGGHLAVISSITENVFVQKLLSSVGPSAGYIGHYRSRNGQQPWVWDAYWKGPVDDDAVLPSDGWRGRKLADTPGGGEGNEEKEEGHRHQGRKKCYEMEASGLWQVVSCYDRPSESRVVLCERGAPDQTCKCAFDGDDGGGGGGDIDGQQQLRWGGPWFPHGCSCYRQLVTGGGSGVQLSWVEAQAACGSVGARLVSIGSEEENEWVRSTFKGALFFGTVRRGGGGMKGYLGLNNLMDKDRYEWNYYQNWRDGHPHDHDQGDSYAAGGGSSGDGAHGKADGVKGDVSPERPELHHKGHCSQMGRDGKWIRASCRGQTSSCFVCKRERAGPYPNLREGDDHQEQWHVEVVDREAAYNRDGWRGPWCDDCFPATLRHSSTKQYLCIDAQNAIFMSWARDPSWCLLTLVVHHEHGHMAIVTTHGAALFYDHGRIDEQQGTLHVEMLQGRAAPPLSSRLFHPLKEMERKYAAKNTTSSSWVAVALDTQGVAKFHTSHAIGSIAWRYLRITIAARSRDLQKVNIKECSVAVYDTSPRTNSYECHLRPPGRWDDLVSLEQEALLFFDQSTFAAPRVPLPNGRVRCENQSPTETGTCTFAYGQGLTLSRQFRANWGYTVSDVITHRINAAPTQTALFRIPPITMQKKNKTMDHGKQLLDRKHLKKLGFGKHGQKTNKPTPQPQVTDLTLSVSELKEFINAFSVAYNNFYEILITKSYVETRNWQMSVPVAPRTTDTIQFWLSSENLRYRWRALFAARGGFTISVFGRPIGNHHSLGDLSYFRDLFFFIFGTYEFPYEAEIIITVNDLPGDGWPLPLPETSQGDRVKDVARNGQLGFGYGAGDAQYDGGGGGIFGGGHGGGKGGG